ncbi:ABC transporter substrate-binding protein [Mesorhizobium sp. CN5-321]|jgi:iron complex transport system substrate-binding protein|uniref:heme/hemin ABC transporter substrate-binding protein n=1 Tax=Mesorhizobium hunchu TaxID=3157708 RepID=UPI0032B7356E
MSAWLKTARLAAFGLALAAVARPAVAEDATVLPDTSRVVAIGGAVTEIVFALGEQKHLVARDSTGTYPEAAKALPDVGYMRALSPEGVLSVDPTGIIALQGSGPKEAVDVLKKASVPYVEVPETYDNEGILERIRVVGKALGVEDKAAALAAETQAKLKAAEARTAGIDRKKRVLFILSMQGGKIMAAGAHTGADGIVTLAGAANAIEGFSGYKQLSDEAIVTAAPDVILMMDHAGPGVSDDDLFGNAAISQTPAGQARRVIRMDGGYLLGYGPRTADAISDLSKALYGDKAAD